MAKKKQLEDEFPILQEAKNKVKQFNGPWSNIDTEFIKRFISEYKLLALQNKKLRKQVMLMKLLQK